MIRKLIASIIAGTTLLLGGVVFAQTGNIDVIMLPKLEQYVTDFAGVLDATTLTQLNQDAYAYEQGSGHQFVAVLIPDRQGKELFDISLEIFNENKIGNKNINNGLLLVIATDEKKVRIMVGYGLEGEMPDVLASKIIEEDIRPLVNSGDFAGAVRAYYARSQEVIASGEGKNMQPSGADENNGEEMFFAVALFAYFFGKNIRSSKKAKSKKKLSWLPTGIISWIILIVALFITASILPLIIYAGAAFFGYIAGASFLFFPGGFGGGGRGGGGGGFGGGFSGGGGSSGGGGAGD